MKTPWLECALVYDRHGSRVFPVARPTRDDDGDLICGCRRGVECADPGKHPLRRGWRDEPTDTAPWDGPLAKPNIGILTGAESGIVVLDVDPRHDGDKTLADLEAKFGALPKTWRFVTGGDGLHILFRHPGGYVKSKPGALGPGLDCKAEGGFIVAPPSLHKSGRHYAIDPAHHPDNVQIASLPDWLRDRLARQQRRRSIRAERPVRPSNGLSRYGEAALDNACRRILAAINGSQEMTINAEAYSIGRLAGAGAVPADFALRALQYAAARVVSFDGSRPWSNSQLAAKVERSFGDGARNPRRVRR